HDAAPAPIEAVLGRNEPCAYVSRDGYTTNTVPGNGRDSRDDLFGRAGFLLTPGNDWDIVARVWGERDHDGDYALGDLAALRQQPFQVSRNLEGFTRRDVIGTSLVASHPGESLDFTSVTGFVYWQTD